MYVASHNFDSYGWMAAKDDLEIWHIAHCFAFKRVHTVAAMAGADGIESVLQ